MKESLTFTNPAIALPDEDHGDPFVLRVGGTYFLYHTGSRSVPVYTSSDLANWAPHGDALTVEHGPVWAQTDLWAPEVFKQEGTYYMYVAATSLGRDARPDDDARRLGLATSASPTGPFALDQEPLIADEWAIDAHPFRDVAGDPWLIYNVRNEQTRYRDGTTGCGNVIDRLIDPRTLAGDPRPVAFPSESWEGTTDGTWYWNEGAVVLRRRDQYIQMYSGGFYGDDTYAVGLATAKTLRGPWSKDESNPVFIGSDRIRGPGHHSVTVGPDGVTPYAIYHGHVVGSHGRKVHLDRLWWIDGRPLIGLPRGRRALPREDPQPMPSPAAYDPEVPTWHGEWLVRGRSFVVADVEVAISTDYPVAVTARQTSTSGLVSVDGRPVGEWNGLRQPHTDVAGVIESAIVTSYLEDDARHVLHAGEQLRFGWGGERSVEVTAAIRGQVSVEFGNERRHVESRGDFALYNATLPGPVADVTFTSHADGSEVSDVTLVSRQF